MTGDDKGDGALPVAIVEAVERFCRELAALQARLARMGPDGRSPTPRLPDDP